MAGFAPYRSTYDVSSTNEDKATMKDDRRYDQLRNLDDDSDSNTEVEEWEPEIEHQPRGRRRRTLWAKVKSYRWMLDTGLLLVIFGLLAEKRWKRWSHGPRSHIYELAGDITGFAPEFSQQIVKFTADPVFAPENASEFWGKETQQAWLDIVPTGLGYVEVKDAGNYSNLPRPIHDYPGKAVFTTSVTHQLHCLYTILEAYNTLQVSSENPAFAQPIKMPWHINHCFEYIRQAIMCAGDVALEGAATTFPGDDVTGEDRGGSDGWDAKHVCKDYGQVYDYLERATINHQKWISSE